MRAEAIGMALLLLASTAARAADPWYEAYAAGVKAVDAQQWTQAEARLKAALRDGPAPGRNVRTYGTRFILFNPRYYLGVVYFNQSRFKEALAEFDQVEKAGLVRPGDPESATMARLRQEAAPKTSAVATPPVTEPPRPVPPTTAVTPPPTTLAAHREPEASAPPVTAPPASAAAAAPQGEAGPPSVPADQPGRDEAERLGIQAFYEGRYEAALRALEPLLAGSTRRPRALLYAAFSNAALGYMGGEGGATRIARAKEQTRQARRMDPRLSPDTRWISPRLREVWESSRR